MGGLERGAMVKVLIIIGGAWMKMRGKMDRSEKEKQRHAYFVIFLKENLLMHLARKSNQQRGQKGRIIFLELPMHLFVEHNLLALSFSYRVKIFTPLEILNVERY